MSPTGHVIRPFAYLRDLPVQETEWGTCTDALFLTGRSRRYAKEVGEDVTYSGGGQDLHLDPFPAAVPEA